MAKQTVVPIMSGAPDKYNELKLEVDGDIARCTRCHSMVGTVSGRNLICGEAIIVGRAPIRCRYCKERHRWEPLPT